MYRYPILSFAFINTVHILSVSLILIETMTCLALFVLLRVVTALGRVNVGMRKIWRRYRFISPTFLEHCPGPENQENA